MEHRRRPLLLGALLLALPAAVVRAELQACLGALGKLNTAPYNASLPFLNGVSGTCHWPMPD